MLSSSHQNIYKVISKHRYSVEIPTITLPSVILPVSEVKTTPKQVPKRSPSKMLWILCGPNPGENIPIPTPTFEVGDSVAVRRTEGGVKGKIVGSTIEPQIGGAYLVFYKIKQSDGKVISAQQSQVNAISNQ